MVLKYFPRYKMIFLDLINNLELKRPIVKNTNGYWLTNDVSKIKKSFLKDKYLKMIFDVSTCFLNNNHTDSFYYIKNNNINLINIKNTIKLNNSIKNLYDVIFISNKEPVADENYKRLLSLNIKNKIMRVDSINGRNKAYKEAAKLSTTPYFFAVFSKIYLDDQFDFTFGCEIFDKRHYVFSSLNPVNNLRYGHQAVILYNKEQVLINPGDNIDFTLNQPYRHVDILSGIANYNTSKLNAWRCAFREVLKLHIFKNNNDKLAKSRIDAWLTGHGDYYEYSILGAKDAIEYYKLYNTNYHELMKSYDWNDLDNIYKRKYL